MRKIISICSLILFYGFIQAQSFDWIKTDGSENNDDCIGIYKTNSDYITLNMFSDSFSAGGKDYSTPIQAFQSFYWLFRNKKGEVKKVIKIEQDSIYKRYIKKLDNGRMFLNLDYSTFDSFYLNGKKINVKKEFPIIEIDTLGSVNLFNTIQIINSEKVFKPTLQIASYGDNIICLFRVGVLNIVKIGNDTINGSDAGYCALKYDYQGNLLKVARYPINLIPWAFENCDKGLFRVMSNLRNTSDSFNYLNANWSYENEFNVFTHLIDTNLVISEFQRIPGGNFNSRSIATFGTNGFFYNADYFIDSAIDEIDLGLNKIAVIKGRQTFIVYWSNNGVKFYKHLKINTTKFTNPAQNLAFKKNQEFCTIGGQLVSPIIIQPDSMVLINPENDANIFGLKLDTFGNILWNFVAVSEKSIDQFRELYVDTESAVFGGHFSGTLKLNSDSFVSNGKTDAVLISISDNSIYRDNINPGPYCAGDSIFVPYRMYGKYHDTNTFFAELSDENGNFYGTPRILGMWQSTVSGVIPGILPMFDVISSGNYRIRIRSNSPFVQSFMRYDSLHLLVYSRDKANPGPDTTICFGNPLPISAKGGTLWHWSPGNSVVDSSARKTVFLGKQTTTLRITIADSSGCGEPDTAFQRITVLPPPKLKFSDTTVCVNTTFTIEVDATGGMEDSLKYEWLLPDMVFLGKTFISKIQSDSFFRVAVNDGCSSIGDTGIINVILPGSPVIFTSDTTVCKGVIAALYPRGKSELSKPIEFTWFLNDTILGMDSLKIIPQFKTHLVLQAIDNCSPDTTFQPIILNVFNSPSIKSFVDSVCSAFQHKIQLMGSSGLPAYQYLANNMAVDSVLFIAAEKQKTWVFQAKDACVQLSTPDTVILYQKPLPKLTTNPISGCEPFQSMLISQNPLKFSGYWIKPNGDQVSYLNDTLWVLMEKAGNYNYKIVLQNAICSDTAEVNLVVSPKPKANFELTRKDVLIEDASTRALNTSVLSKLYIWKWGQNSRTDLILDTINFTFTDTGIFKVELIAENNFGCRDTAFDFISVHPNPIIWIPNGITMNGDGLNESLEPDGVGIRDYKLTIINKWGEVVFKGAENQPWVPNNDIIPGVYVYRCVFSNWKGVKSEKNGTVLVIK